MYKKSVIVGMFFCFVSAILAFDTSLSQLSTPVYNHPNQLSIGFLSRLGEDAFRTSDLGSTNGSNIAWDGFLSLGSQRGIDFYYSMLHDEFAFGFQQNLYDISRFSRWSRDLTQSLEVDFYFYSTDQDVDGIFVTYSLQDYSPLKKWIKTVNLFYDNYSQLSTMAFALEYKLNSKFSILSEYVVSNGEFSDESSYLYGFKFEKFGHQFSITIQNSNETSIRQLVNGIDSEDGDAFLGIKVERIFELHSFSRKSQYLFDYDRYIEEAQNDSVEL